MNGRCSFIVQDKESALFLFPHDGDVGLTQWIDQAGRFDTQEEAIETASFHCAEGFIIFPFITIEQ